MQLTLHLMHQHYKCILFSVAVMIIFKKASFNSKLIIFRMNEFKASHTQTQHNL